MHRIPGAHGVLAPGRKGVERQISPFDRGKDRFAVEEGLPRKCGTRFNRTRETRRKFPVIREKGLKEAPALKKREETSRA